MEEVAVRPTFSGTRRGNGTDGSTVTIGFWVRLSLVAERQEWSWLARSHPGLPSCAVAGAAVGADWGCLSVMEALGRISSSTLPLVALFALGNLDFAFALVSFSPSGVGVLPVEYVVFSGRVRCLVQQWIHFPRDWTNFTHFLRCGELESRGVSSPFGLKGEVCPVDASGCSLALRSSHVGS